MAEAPYTIKRNLVIAETRELRVIDLTLAPGECVPWHLHPDNDDLFICLAGTLEVREINPERVAVLRAAEQHRVPKREPHTAVNVSGEDCRFLIVQGPGRYEFRPLPKLDAAWPNVSLEGVWQKIESLGLGDRDVADAVKAARKGGAAKKA